MTHASTHDLYAMDGVEGQSSMHLESSPPGQLDSDCEAANEDTVAMHWLKYGFCSWHE